jgi:hypothetical protein
MKLRWLLFLVTIPIVSAQTLTYAINWPSGLSLGETSLTSQASGEGMEYRMVIQIGFPGIPIRDEYVSKVNAQGCSMEFTKEAQHGARKIHEKLTFNGVGGMKRETPGGGGVSNVSVPNCAYDALAYLFFVRKELAQGRMPSSGTAIFGAQYQVSVMSAGAQQIMLGSERVEADRYASKVKGPASEQNFEMFFLRDAARTPALVKIQFPVGTFSMELVR